jgi:MFS family permease
MLASPTLPVILGAMAFQGLLSGPMDVAMFTLRQRQTDPAWMGRAFAVSMSLNFLGYPVGAAIGGVLVVVGTDVALAVAVAFTVLAGLSASLLLPRPAPREKRPPKGIVSAGDGSQERPVGRPVEAPDLQD